MFNVNYGLNVVLIWKDVLSRLYPNGDVLYDVVKYDGFESDVDFKVFKRKK